MASLDLPRVLDIALDLPAAAQPHRRGGAERPAKRLKLWQIPANWLCSVIGTCLTPADIVFCPIDCISHHACLKAKHLCRRLAKPFVPLRSSSATCFARAIEAWSR